MKCAQELIKTCTCMGGQCNGCWHSRPHSPGFKFLCEEDKKWVLRAFSLSLAPKFEKGLVRNFGFHVV
jgi:hypothetical protein